MKIFQYHKPKTLKEALALAENPGSRFIAGGTNLLDLMKRGVEAPGQLIDINALPLRKIEYAGEILRIGALVSNTAAASHSMIRSKHPLLAEALNAGASGQLRNMATIGGNVMQRTRCTYFYDTAFSCNKRNPGSGCDAGEGISRAHAVFGTDLQNMHKSCIAVHPGDMSVALLALDAKIVVAGAAGERRIPFADFYRLPGSTPQEETLLQRGELIIAVELADSPFTRHVHYLKVRDRASYAFAIVSVAAAIDFFDNKTIRAVRLTMGGVAHKPWRMYDAENYLTGKILSANIADEAGDIAMKTARPAGQSGFKIQLSKKSIVQALHIAAGKS